MKNNKRIFFSILFLSACVEPLFSMSLNHLKLMLPAPQFGNNSSPKAISDLSPRVNYQKTNPEKIAFLYQQVRLLASELSDQLSNYFLSNYFSTDLKNNLKTIVDECLIQEKYNSDYNKHTQYTYNSRYRNSALNKIFSDALDQLKNSYFLSPAISKNALNLYQKLFDIMRLEDCLFAITTFLGQKVKSEPHEYIDKIKEELEAFRKQASDNVSTLTEPTKEDFYLIEIIDALSKHNNLKV